MKNRNFGTLYGIGVGPGDPELVTIKAVRLLERVGVVFAAASTKNDHSHALEISRPYISEKAEVVLLKFPMTRDKKILEEAWEKNALAVLEILKKGINAAFITIGDPLTYSTFGYLMKTLESIEPGVKVGVVPGITSYQAAAAASRTVIAESEETVSIVSGAKGAERLREVLKCSDTVVLLKVYRHYEEILETLEELGLKDSSTLVSHLGREGETIEKSPDNHKDKKVPYLSLMLVKKKR